MTTTQSNILQDTRIINVNSKDSIVYNTGKISDVLFKFKNILSDESEILYVTGGVLNAQFPVSFYNVNVNNQILNYKVNGVSYSLTIPEGNYDSNTFIISFQSQFSLGGHGKTISLSLSSLTGRLTINVPGYTLVLNYLGSTLFYVLGLSTVTDYTITSSYLCPYPTNLLGVKKILVCSSALAPFSAFDSVNNTPLNLVQTFSNNEPPFGQIYFENATNTYQILKNKTINEIDIQIRDENYALIDFNGIDWSITFQLNIFRNYTVQSKVLNLNDLNVKIPIQTQEMNNIPLPIEENNDIEDMNTINDLDILKYNGEANKNNDK